MKTTIKNTIKAVVLAMGFCAVGANAAPINSCKDLKAISNFALYHLKGADPVANLNQVAKDKGFNNGERYVVVGVGAYLYEAEQQGEYYGDAIDTMIGACRDGGTGWTMTLLITKAHAYLQEVNIE